MRSEAMANGSVKAANGGDNNSPNSMLAMPPWVRIIVSVGFPIFVAIYFMGLLDGILPTTIGAHQKQLEAQTVTISAIKKSVEDSTRIWRQICMNTSKTEIAQIECQR